MPLVFPVHPRTRERLRGFGLDGRLARLSGLARDRSRRLPRLPEADVQRPAGAHRLGRHPGGDDHPRRAVPHAAREHGAAGHGRARDQPAGRKRPRPDPGGLSQGDRGRRAAGPAAARLGWAAPPAGSSRCWSEPCEPGERRDRAGCGSGGAREPRALGRDALPQRGGDARDLHREGARLAARARHRAARSSSPTTAAPTARRRSRPRLGARVVPVPKRAATARR